MSEKATFERLVNRSALQFFDDLNPIPQTFDELDSHLENRLREPASHHARRALNYLVDAGYVSDVRASAGDRAMYKITAKGTAMIRKNVPAGTLDLMVFDHV